MVTKGQQTRCILVVTEQFCILTMVWDTKLTHALIHIELNTDTETYTHTHKVQVKLVKSESMFCIDCNVSINMY